jgi:hypothetical protein
MKTAPPLGSYTSAVTCGYAYHSRSLLYVSAIAGCAYIDSVELKYSGDTMLSEATIQRPAPRSMDTDLPGELHTIVTATTDISSRKIIQMRTDNSCSNGN